MLEGILAKMRTGSVIALHEVEQISSELASRLRNATEHMSDNDAALIQEVIDIIRGSVYASMTSSHVEEQAELDDALARIQKCNDDMASEIAGTGKVGRLLTRAENHQSTYKHLEGEQEALATS